MTRRGNLLDVSAEGERGSLLEHQLKWLGESVSSELGNPMEEGGLERTRTCVWRLLSLNVKIQEARAHRLLVFRNLGEGQGWRNRNLSRSKMETIPESPAFCQDGRRPFSGAPPPAVWLWWGPRLAQPFLTAPRGTSSARFPFLAVRPPP